MKTKIGIIIFIPFIVIFSHMNCNSKRANETKNRDNLEKISRENLTGTYEILNEDREINIPFEIFRNDIRMVAQVNGKECYILLDNGSLWDELLFFGSPKIDSLQLNVTGETVIGDTTVENPLMADIATGISIGFADVVFNDQAAIITRYQPGLPNLWEGADGQISAAFFKNFIVEINFDESIVRLIPPEKFKYVKKDQEIKMHPGPFNSRTINVDIIMQDGTKTLIDLLVDLGGVHPVYLPIGRDDSIRLPENAVKSIVGNGLTGPIYGYMGRIKSIKIGNYTLKDVITAFTVVDNENDIYGNTMIGMPLLQRFNIIFDYFNNKMFLEPNQMFKDPFKFNMTGLEFTPDPQKNLRVTNVYPNSSASEVDIQIGDIITHINGTRIGEYKAEEISLLLKNEGSMLELEILRADKIQHKTIMLKQVL